MLDRDENLGVDYRGLFKHEILRKCFEVPNFLIYAASYCTNDRC